VIVVSSFAAAELVTFLLVAHVREKLYNGTLEHKIIKEYIHSACAEFARLDALNMSIKM
jgi:hypothetical protein